QFNITASSVYRSIHEAEAKRLLDQPLDYIYNESFDDPAKEAEIAGPMPDAEDYEAKRNALKVPKDAPPELASLYNLPLLSKDQEQHLFRKMNFFKHKAHQLRMKLNPMRARTQDFKEIEQLQEQAAQVKDHLISCNM